MTKKPGDKKLDTFLDDTLNKEEGQERNIEAHEGSFFEDAPGEAAIVARAREFDDLHKHWVRRELWLKTVKRIARAKKAGIRLLTLPGQHRFEIQLYLKEKLIETIDLDGDERLGVVGIEADPTIFGLLVTSEPRLLELLRGDVLNALIQPQSENGKVVRARAPYDVINLDLTANIATPSDGPYSPFLQGVRECFQVQGSQTGRWALMVTFRAGMLDTDPRVIDELSKFFQKNLEQHLKVKEACLDRYKVGTATEVLAKEPEEALGQITAKWIIEQGHMFEWECPIYQHASYVRTFTDPSGNTKTYSLRKLLFEFNRRLSSSRQIVLGSVPPQSWHADDLARLFAQSSLLDVDACVAKIAEGYRSKLEHEIEQFRGGSKATT
jgi:hypothetical protein